MTGWTWRSQALVSVVDTKQAAPPSLLRHNRSEGLTLSVQCALEVLMNWCCSLLSTMCSPFLSRILLQARTQLRVRS